MSAPPGSGPPFPPPTGSPVLPAPKRWPRVMMWISVTLIVIGVVGLVGDWATRSYEMLRLTAAIERSEAAMATAQDGIGAVALSDHPDAAEKERATHDLAAISATGRDAVSSAGAGVAGLSFLPWHTEVIRAQAAYLDHNAAWVEYLDRGSDTPLTLFQDDNRIEPTWVAAEKYVRAGVPFPALPPLAWRIDDIFRDEEPADPPGGVPA